MTAAVVREDRCPACGSAEVGLVGQKRGAFRPRAYTVMACGDCGCAYVKDPDTDFHNLYNMDYYEGRGADPLVSYSSEMRSAERSVRVSEWRGIAQIVLDHMPVLARKGGTWLDLGCGNGGLIDFVAKHHPSITAIGLEDGEIARKAAALGRRVYPTQTASEHQGQCDVVTAIEVLEHCLDPGDVLRRCADLLRPGGLLFATTGNAARQARVLNWGYLRPEIHITLFTPQALVRSYERAGLVPTVLGSRGWRDVIRFKILKNLGQERSAWWHACLPWSLLSRVADHQYGVSAMPCAFKPA